MNLTNWDAFPYFVNKSANSSISSGPFAANNYTYTINPSYTHTTSNVAYNTDYSTIEIGIETLSFGYMTSFYYNHDCYYESVL